MILLGALLMTFGTDLLIISHNDPVGTPLGVIASLAGVMLLTGGILNHHRLSLRRRSDKTDAGTEASGAGPRGKPSDRRF
jgi:hypothetical protein